ncbi:MAG TPA: cupin domain-containing protein [Bacteroidota bacterium]|nr:cupin domain-containing protein [Bacteroidota bacterium]
MTIDPKLPEGALKFPELVDYATGSIVSKQLIKRESGSVTVFSFDKGQSLSEHTASSDALAYVAEGTAEFSIGRKVTSVRKDEFIILPANVPHAVNAIEKFKMVLVMMKA